jgi:hypothetical protein
MLKNVYHSIVRKARGIKKALWGPLKRETEAQGTEWLSSQPIISSYY